MNDDLLKRLRSVQWSVTGEPCSNGNVDETCCDEAADRIEALEAMLREAVEALKPFGECADFYEPDWLDEQETEERLTIGELRRARAVLAKLTGE